MTATAAVAAPSPKATFSHEMSSDMSTSVRFRSTTSVTVLNASSARSRPQASNPSSDAVATPAGPVVDLHVLPREEQAEEKKRTGDEDDLRTSREGFELRHANPFGCGDRERAAAGP